MNKLNDEFYFCKRCGNYHQNPDFPGKAEPGSIFYDHFNLRKIPSKGEKSEIPWKIYKRHGGYYTKENNDQYVEDITKLLENGFEVLEKRGGEKRMLFFRPRTIKGDGSYPEDDKFPLNIHYIPKEKE